MKTVRLILLAWISIFAIKANAQIGYQVSLLNSATGEPRGGETVSVDIKLTNSENATVYTTRQTATSNDFGVLTLSVGDAKTFDKMDWSKLPLYIEVSIDGVLIAKSQVLSVPVAEYAKKSGTILTEELLASKQWAFTDPHMSDDSLCFSFNQGGTASMDWPPVSDDVINGNYYINNETIVFVMNNSQFSFNSIILHYVPQINALVDAAGRTYY